MTHTGTRIDVPRHVVGDGLSVSDFRPEELVFDRPVIFDLPLSDDRLVMPEDLKGFERRGTPGAVTDGVATGDTPTCGALPQVVTANILLRFFPFTSLHWIDEIEM